MSALIVATPNLDALAEQINAAHKEAQAYASKAVERALVAGDLLNTVKEQIKHGEFLPWCKEHCPDITPRTLQSYMRVARELPIEMRSASHLSVREALRLVAGEPEPLLLEQPKTDQPKGKPFWEEFEPAKNAGFCRMWPKDRLHACAYMNAQGTDWDEIATRLGLDIREVESALEPEFPEIIWETRDEDNPEEHRKFIAQAKSAAKRLIYSIRAQRLEQAAWTAEHFGDSSLAAILKGQKQACRQNEKRHDQVYHPLVDSIGTSLARTALGIAYFQPALWIEEAKAAIWVDIQFCDVDTTDYHSAYCASDFCKDSVEAFGAMSFADLENRRKKIWEFDNHWGFKLHKLIPESAIEKLHREIYQR